MIVLQTATKPIDAFYLASIDNNHQTLKGAENIAIIENLTSYSSNIGR